MLGDTNSPSFVSEEYKDQIDDWDTVADIFQGRRSWYRRNWIDYYKAAIYLPREPKEEDDNYFNRLARSHFDNRFAPTIKDFAALLSFFRLSDDSAQSFRDAIRNIDLRGTSLNTFFQMADIKSLRDGHCFIMVEHPKLPIDEFGNPLIRTVGDETRYNLRPYLILIDARDVLSWDLDFDVTGRQVISQMVIREWGKVSTGHFGRQSQLKYRVLTPGWFEVYTVLDNGELEIEDYGRTNINRVPVVPYASEPDCDPFVARPPLLDLVDINIKHYQMSSDYFEVLHKVNLPTLVMEGMLGPGVDLENLPPIRIGPNSTIWTPPTTTAKFIEPTGAAIGATRTALEDLSADMDRRTLQFLSSKKAQKTATEVNMESAQTSANLTSVANLKESAAEEICAIWSEYTQEDTSGTIEINKQILKPPMAPDEVNALLGLVQGQIITKRTGLLMLDAGNYMPKEFDPDAELEAIKADQAIAMEQQMAMQQQIVAQQAQTQMVVNAQKAEAQKSVDANKAEVNRAVA